MRYESDTVVPSLRASPAPGLNSLRISKGLLAKGYKNIEVDGIHMKVVGTQLIRTDKTNGGLVGQSNDYIVHLPSRRSAESFPQVRFVTERSTQELNTRGYTYIVNLNGDFT